MDLLQPYRLGREQSPYTSAIFTHGERLIVDIAA
jgi:hypothetical protein